MNTILKPLFQNYLRYTFKHIILQGLIIFIEQFLIFISLFINLFKLLESDVKIKNNNDLNLVFEFFHRISPLELTKNSLDCTYKDFKNNSVCRSTSTLILLQWTITISIVVFFFIIKIRENFEESQKKDLIFQKVSEKKYMWTAILNFYLHFFVNFFEIIVHLFSLIIFYLNFNEIISIFCLINPSNTTNNLLTNTNALGIEDIIKGVTSLMLLFFYFYIYISLKRSINLIVQYNKDLSTPYDNIFSIKFDIFNYILKILIALSFAFKTNKFLNDKSIYFVDIFEIIFFFLFSFYIFFSTFVSKDILFLSNIKPNLLRIFFILNNFINILFIIIFNEIYYKNYYVAYICIFTSFVICIFLTFLIQQNNFKAIYSSTNYISQLVYILNMKFYSTDIQLYQEVSNIMFYHKSKCQHFKFCSICQLDSFSFKNFLVKFYEQSKIFIKNKSIYFKNLKKSDLDTFDIIKLLVTEILYQKRTIKLIYKSRRILEKFEIKKRFNNNYYNIVIYSEYLKKFITRSEVLKFKVINCYQSTREEINEVINVIETILFNINCGEKNLFQKSSELYDLKEKILKNTIFLTQNHHSICDSYSLIIYRFIFKNLFNNEISDCINSYDFDDNKEYMEYTYNNEKLIQMKLDFSNNRLNIIRIGKDMINFRDKNLDYLIPLEFKDYFINILIKKIKNNDENEENRLFELTIIDNDNNIKSMKIKFSVLISLKLDEVILIGQYDIIKDNLVLIKKNNRLLISENNTENTEENKIQNALKSINSGGNSSNNNLDKEFNLKLSDEDEKLIEGENLSNLTKAEKNREKFDNYDTKDFKDLKSTKITTNKPKDKYKKPKRKKVTKKESASENERDGKTPNKTKGITDLQRIQIREKERELSENLFQKNSVYLSNFSEDLTKIFFLRSAWLPRIQQKLSIPFSNIFEKVRANEDENKLNSYIFGRLDYQKFYGFYQSIISFIEEEMNNEDIRDNLKKFKKLLKNSKNEIYRFDYLYDIEPPGDYIYILFKIKPIILKNGKEDLLYNNSFLLEKSDEMESESGNNQIEIERIGEKFFNRESTSISSSSTSVVSKPDMYLKLDSTRKTINRNDLRMNKFTIISFIFCIFLIIYCLIFLVIGLINNNNIRKLYKIRNDFNDFRYFFYHTNVNIFYICDVNRNVDEDIETNQNKENAYVKRFKKENNITINISKFIIDELEIKLNLIRERYNELQANIFNSYYRQKLDKIFNKKTIFKQINYLGESFTITRKEKVFFETMNIFFNHGKVVVENINQEKYIYLNLINIENDKIIFGDYTDSDANAKNINIKLYELIINYIQYHKNFEVIGKEMNDLFKEALDDVFNTTYLLSFILMGNHLLLFLGGIVLISFLQKILRQNSQMLIKFSNDENINYMKEKIKYIKNLNLLFIKNPRIIIQNINKSASEYMKKFSAKKKGKFSKYTSNNKKHNSKEEEGVENLNLKYYGENNEEVLIEVKYFDNLRIIMPFVQIFFILFIIFYSYSISFYFIFDDSYSDFTRTADFGNKNINLDNDMMNNINLINTMILTNKTDKYLGKEILGQEKPIMMDLIKLSLQIRIDIIRFKDISERFNTFDTFEKKLMNCSYIFERVNDPIIEKIVDKADGKDEKKLLQQLKNICSGFPFMKTTVINNLFQEMVYKTLYIFTEFETNGKDIDSLIKSYNNEILFEVFLTFTFIYRPIRKFTKDYVYENVLLASSNNFLVITIIYLILNILMDLLIFFVTNRMIVKKISDINRHLNNMITCISFRLTSATGNNNNNQLGN